ncbi:MAG: sulfatase-like hydrolase/transferase [Bacteroidales bacterium]
MKNKLYTLLKIYLGFVGIFALQKPLFMLYHLSLYKGDTAAEWLKVIYHGLPLDFSMAGYLTIIPVLMILVSVWKEGSWLRKALHIYFALINMVIAIVFVSDLELYSYWGFRLDSTPLFYLKSPANAAASVPMLMMFVMPLLMLLTWFVLYKLMKRTTDEPDPQETDFRKRIMQSATLSLLLGMLFIPIRGGFSVSTMNVGKVYHSTNMLLNHAAINPMFSLMTSLTKEGDFGSQYRFMENEEAEQVFSLLKDSHRLSQQEENLLHTKRPNVILIVLESFSAKIVEPLGGISEVAPTMNRLYDEGIAFTNFYANSFRTDRGLVSILSGYPAQPSTSIMKYPAKTQSLPSLSGTLKNAGYDLEFLYGGDADFTNMRSYFMSAGFNRIVADQDFPVADRLSKWGVNDEKTFRFLSESLKEQSQPFMKMFLTLSSHEPFDVPMHKFDDPYLNSVAYTDSCLGVFMDELKASPLWDNTLVILVPDHAMHYPASISISEPGRYHIPMIWAGGAISKPQRIDTYGSQIDIAASLLHQMQLPYDDFTFSKDLFNTNNRQFAYYTFKDGFGILKDSATFVYDCASDRAIMRTDNADREIEQEGKAFLQCLYNDLDKR